MTPIRTAAAPDQAPHSAKTPGTSRLRRSIPAVLAAAVIALAPAAGTLPAATAASSEASGTTLKLALTGDIDSLNPFKAILASSTNILALQYQSLVAYGPKNNEDIPSMADKWETSPDGKVWTFHLPKDRKWSDGEPITAKDGAWTFKAIQTNDELKQANGSLLSSVQSVEAKDDETLVITLNAPQAPNPGTQLPIMPEHVWSKVGDPAKYTNDKDTVGSGPFIVTSYDKTAGVSLKSNPYYWEGKAKIDGITYAPYKNTDAAVQALKTGEVDLISGLTPAQYKALQNQPGITTNAGTGRRYQAIGINPGTTTPENKLIGDGNPALQDVQLRRAIVMAIDNKTLLEKVLQGLGQEATGEVPLAYPQYNWDTKDLPLKYNPKAANELLDKAGYTKGADGIRLDKTGKPLKLRLAGRNSEPTHQQMADYVKPWLKEIGIDVTTVMKSSAQLNDDSVVGNFDLYFTGWGMGPDPDFQLSINTCASRPNADGTGATSENNYCSPEFDAIFKQQHEELDQAKRSALVKKAQELIYNAAVNNVMYYANTLEAYRSDKFEPFVTQPEEGGVITGQNGPWGYYSATPVSSKSGTEQSDGGFNPAAVIVPAVIVVVLAAGGFVLYRRRNATAGDRE
ncbi:ABC transporter substrate-binding protein [Pseudarthrobacter sp. J1738]|uniref:ABC transporter substrate-binding protein n=1 Tax=Pseudarthrobacter sp. J1738 TaxID=3420446 RepID=UPI003D292FCD